MRVPIEQRDDRDALAEEPVERVRVAVAEARAGLEGAEQQVGARDADELDLQAGVLLERVEAQIELADQRMYADKRGASREQVESGADH